MPFDIMEILIRARDQTGAAITSVNHRLHSVEQAVESVKSKFVFLASTVGTALGELSVKGAIDSLTDLEHTANRLHIPVEDLQAFQFAAVQTGVSVESMNTAILRFNRNLGTAKEDTGTFATSLHKLEQEGLGLNIFDETGTKLRKSSEVLTDFFIQLGKVKDTSTQTAIAVGAFGREGGRIAAIVHGGADAFRALIQAAHDTGAVIDKELIERTAELGNRLNAITFVIKARLNVALVQAGPLLVQMAEHFATLVTQITSYIEVQSRMGEMNFDSALRNLDLLIEKQQTLNSVAASSLEAMFAPIQAFINRKTDERAGFKIFMEPEVDQEKLNAQIEIIQHQVDVASQDVVLGVKVDPDLVRKLQKASSVLSGVDVTTLSPEFVELRNNIDATLDMITRFGTLAAESGDEADGAFRDTRIRVNDLFLATEALQRQIKLLGATSTAERERIAAGFDFTDSIDKILSAAKDIPTTLKTQLQLAAREGPGAIRQQLNEIAETAPEVSKSLVAAIGAYISKLHEADVTQKKTFTDLKAKLEDIRATAEATTLELKFKISTGGQGLLDDPTVAFLKARKDLQDKLNAIDKDTFQVSDSGVIASANAARLAAQQQFSAQVVANAQDQQRKVNDVVTEMQISGLKEEDRARAQGLEDIRQYYRDRIGLVRAGSKEEGDLHAAVQQKVDELNERTNVWMAAFKVDVAETGVQAFKQFGDTAQSTLFQLQAGTITAKEAIVQLANEIASTTERLILQIAVTAAMKKVVSELSDSFPGTFGTQVNAGDVTSAATQQVAGETMSSAALTQQTAAAVMQSAAAEMTSAAATYAAAAAGGTVGPVPGIVVNQAGGLNTALAAAQQQSETATIMSKSADLLGAATSKIADVAVSFADILVDTVNAIVSVVSSVIKDIAAAASLQTGGITTQEGFVKVHPKELIIPIDRLGEIIAQMNLQAPSSTVSSQGGIAVIQNLNISQGGDVSVSQRTQSGGSGSDTAERGTALAGMLRDAVINVIVNEQRPGGSLEGTRRR